MRPGWGRPKAALGVTRVPSSAPPAAWPHCKSGLGGASTPPSLFGLARAIARQPSVGGVGREFPGVGHFVEEEGGAGEDGFEVAGAVDFFPDVLAVAGDEDS